MRPDKRVRPGFSVLLQGTVFLSLVALGGCDHSDGAAAPEAQAAGSATPSAAPTVVVSTQGPPPLLHVQADAVVTAGTTGHSALASGDQGLTYRWYLDDGKIEGDVDGPSILWTAGDMGYAHVYSAGITAAGARATVMATVKVVPPPAISRFDAKPASVVAGGGTALGWDAADATKLVLDPGEVDVTSRQGAGLIVKPAETTTYTLTATNEAGTVVTKTFTVQIVPPPTVKRFDVTGALTAGQTITLVGEFSGGHAEIRKGDAVLASSDQSPIQAQPVLKDGDTYTLVITNESGATATSSRTFNLQGH